MLYVPINQTGTYTLLTHSTLFGGSSITEPITLAAKFTNISADMNLHAEKQDAIVELIPSSPEENSKTVPEPKIIPEDMVHSTSDLPFDIGIAIGIIIGIVIGIVMILIIRQKPSE